MNKRTFLKLSSAMMASPIISPLLAAMPDDKLTNWAGNLEYGTEHLFSATSVDQVREHVTKQAKLKVLGTRHCFNTIANSTDDFLSVRPMNKIVTLDATARTVTVEGGMSYGQLCPELDSKGFALHNLASLPHISIAGACSTATHGSGDKNGNLATAVTALEMVTAAGDVVQLSRHADGETFRGAVVGLGALGVITKVTLDVQPAFQMRQHVYQDMPMEEWQNDF
jgi:alditol oxidase